MSIRLLPIDCLHVMMKLLISLQFVLIRKGEQNISSLLMTCVVLERGGEEISGFPQVIIFMP